MEMNVCGGRIIIWWDFGVGLHVSRKVFNELMN